MPLPFEYGFTNFIPHFSDVLLYRRIRQTQISVLLHIPRKSRYSIESRFQILICRDIIRHLSVVEFLISIHIEIPCSCKSEEDGLLLSCLLALHSLINRHLDRMAALRRRKNSFHACELLCCLEYGRLLYRARFHISVMVELGQYRTHAVIAKTPGMVCGRNKSVPSVYIFASGHTIPVSQKS